MDKDSSDSRNNRWRSYRLARLGWWLLIVIFGFAVSFGNIETVAAFGLGVFAASIAVAFVQCPVCSQPVGRIGLGKFLRPFIWPFGGWCVACGSRLFLANTSAKA